MKTNALAIVFFLILVSFSFAESTQMAITFYYGIGCPHCARMEPIIKESLNTTFANYSITLVEKEVYQNAANRQEMFNQYTKRGYDPAQGGVPTMIIDDRSLVIGEVDKQRFEYIINEHLKNKSLRGVFTETSFSPIKEENPEVVLTIPVLIGAAMADSINPCTIAIMTLLLGVILTTQGRKKMLLAAAIFIGIVFVCYLSMGLGIQYFFSFASPELTNIFYLIMTIGALALSIMEINAYFNYKPGFTAVEIPMFLRPYMKSIIANATSLPAVALAAFFCSFFLLPCSSGPYLIVLSMLSKAVTLNALFYLIIYNIVFVLPMVIIAGAIFLGKTTVERVGAARDRYVKEMHLFAGLVLFALFLLMAAQILGIRI